MGSKKSKLTVANAKLETALGSCGFGKCTSSCCESEEEHEEKDPRLEYVERAVKVELAIIEHLLLKRMIEFFNNGHIPSIAVNQESESSIKVDITDPVPIAEVKMPQSIIRKIEKERSKSQSKK